MRSTMFTVFVTLLLFAFSTSARLQGNQPPSPTTDTDSLPPSVTDSLSTSITPDTDTDTSVSYTSEGGGPITYGEFPNTAITTGTDSVTVPPTAGTFTPSSTAAASSAAAVPMAMRADGIAAGILAGILGAIVL